MGFAVFLFVVVAWLPGGGMAPPVTRAYLTVAECEDSRHALINQLDARNAAESAPMKIVYSTKPCELVISTSNAKEP